MSWRYVDFDKEVMCPKYRIGMPYKMCQACKHCVNSQMVHRRIDCQYKGGE